MSQEFGSAFSGGDCKNDSPKKNGASESFKYRRGSAVVEKKQSVSSLVEEWKVLRDKSQSDIDATDPSEIDDLAELYGEQIMRVECLIADTDPETVDDVAGMLDVVLDSLESEATDPDNPPLKIVRRLRAKIHVMGERSHLA